MHLPDHYLSPEVAAVSAVAAVGALAWTAVRFRQSLAPSTTTFAATTAVIFAAQMINFPVAAGTSGHLIGGAIAVFALGPWAAMLAMTVVLTVQCVVFADGGVAALGANVLNMAVIAPLVAYGANEFLMRRLDRNSVAGRAISAGTAGWLSVMAAAMACSVQLGLSGTHALPDTLVAMLLIHAAIGLAEGLITAAVMLAVWQLGVNTTPRVAKVPVLFCVVISILLLSPLASSSPDGLEKVGERLQFANVGEEIAIASPLPDYTWPSVPVEVVSTILAGFTGVAICAAAAMSINVATAVLSRLGRNGIGG